jgi:hypothetical protein
MNMMGSGWNRASQMAGASSIFQRGTASPTGRSVAPAMVGSKACSVWPQIQTARPCSRTPNWFAARRRLASRRVHKEPHATVRLEAAGTHPAGFAGGTVARKAGDWPTDFQGLLRDHVHRCARDRRRVIAQREGNDRAATESIARDILRAVPGIERLLNRDTWDETEAILQAVSKIARASGFRSAFDGAGEDERGQATGEDRPDQALATMQENEHLAGLATSTRMGGIRSIAAVM